MLGYHSKFGIFLCKSDSKDIYNDTKDAHFNKHCSFENQHISEESCDTEDWINDCWKFSFTIIGINNILKYI